MHLKKYSYHSFILLLFFGFNKCGCTDDYVRQEERGYYTQNHYELGGYTSLEATITTPLPADRITDFRKKLADRIPKWLTPETAKKPYAIWKDFFKEMPAKIIEALKGKGYDTILLENYYNSLGKLFEAPTEKNEEALIATVEKLKPQYKLIAAWKTYIAKWYNNPEKIFFTEARLAYQELLCFVLNKNNRLPIKLKKAQSDLAKWKEDGHPTGQALWEEIEQKYSKLLKASRVYAYPENQKAIKESLKLIDQLADNLYCWSCKDLQQTLPHGIKQLKTVLDEIGLEEKEEEEEGNPISLLKKYIQLLQDILNEHS